MDTKIYIDETINLLEQIQKEYARIAFQDPKAYIRLKALSLLEKHLLTYQEKVPIIIEIKK